MQHEPLLGFLAEAVQALGVLERPQRDRGQGLGLAAGEQGRAVGPSQDGDGLNDGQVAGIWHGQWNESLQGQWIEQFYKIALSKPFVNSVTYTNLIDTADSIIHHSGLLTDKLESKESFRTLKRLHE
jgi:hypothetical protein